MVQDQIARISIRVANKIDADCIAAIHAGATSSITAAGRSLAIDGTEFVMSGSGGPCLGMYDIIDGKADVEQYNYIPDTLLVHPNVKKCVERLPHFTGLQFYGQPRMQTGFIAVPGKFGDILGLDAYASTNCPTGSAYVLARGRTGNILSQYSPMGYFVERRSLTTAIKPLEERDSIGVYVTTRYGIVVLEGKTICKIININSS